MIILVLNCGSSSIKYQVVDIDYESFKLLAKGIVDRIGLAEGSIVHKPDNKPPYEFIKSVPDHTAGITMILDAIVHPHHGVLETLGELYAVGHRVAHGGEYFTDSIIVDRNVKKQIENCFELAPLHNPANLRGILSIEHILPQTPQVAVFDTSFHQSMPMKNYLYGLPFRYYEELRIRRYGFHGTSHKFVAQKACRLTGKDINKTKIITCHIGNGASVTAIMGGKSYDTSMGFTPVDGLIMGTRCGSIDPGALLYIADKEGINNQKLNDLINKESGVYGITGISSDMRDIEHAAKTNKNERAILALDMYYDRVKKFIGSYAAAMEGVDMIVFTGGVGENDSSLREAVCKGLEFMGIVFDFDLNKGLKGKDMVISLPESRVKVVVATTDEEFVIASDTYRLLKE